MAVRMPLRGCEGLRHRASWGHGNEKDMRSPMQPPDHASADHRLFENAVSVRGGETSPMKFP
jgi:hypothetical protein